MRNRSVVITVIVLAILVIAAVTGTAAVEFKSKNPRYARIALNQAGTKVLLMAFDESGGTGNGYDDLYADTNFNSSLEPSEKQAGRKQGSTGGFTCRFPTISLKVPYNDAGKDVSNPHEVQVYSSKSGQQNKFGLQGVIRLREGSTSWTYTYYGALNTASSVKNATVQKFSTPSMNVNAGPDKQKPGNIGIALGIAVGGWKMICDAQGVPPKVQIVVKNASGNIVHQGSGRIDDFGLG
jgi:hypothetical protein